MANIFHVDTIVADGKTLPFESASASIEGAAGIEYTVVPAASGDDAATRKRVARMLHLKLMFGTDSVQPTDFVKMKSVQIAMRDSVTGKKCICANAGFGKLGAIGSGSADITFNLLSDLQWM